MLFPNDKPGRNEDFKRLSVRHHDGSSRFLFHTKSDYSKQFAHIYASRLNEMRGLLAERVTAKWGNKYPLKRLGDLREDFPEKCVLIGTIFVHQKLKPSILRDISEETQLAPQPVREKFVDDSDALILEDELQRIRLLGAMDVHRFVTGIVCAILGYSEADGKFTVEDSLFYECGPQQPLPELSVSPLLVLISGLDQSSTKDFTLSLELFQQWLYGNVASAHDSADHEAANVVRVIVAGNSVRTTMEMRQRTMLMRQPESVLTLKAVNDVDELMRAWSKSVNVDLMPGEFDPSNLMLPQQPFHPCMFPKSSPCGAFRSVSNPYECSIEDRLVLGTSGQNISNIQKYSNIDDSMDALRSIARWGHVAPTSPDTLPCYPYTEQDPFIIRDCPHILFAGNCSTYQTDVFAGDDDKRIRLVCVPRFSQTQSVAVVNLRTLECKQLCFHIDDFDEVDQ